MRSINSMAGNSFQNSYTLPPSPSLRLDDEDIDDWQRIEDEMRLDDVTPGVEEDCIPATPLKNMARQDGASRANHSDKGITSDLASGSAIVFNGDSFAKHDSLVQKYKDTVAKNNSCGASDSFAIAGYEIRADNSYGTSDKASLGSANRDRFGRRSSIPLCGDSFYEESQRLSGGGGMVKKSVPPTTGVAAGSLGSSSFIDDFGVSNDNRTVSIFTH